MDNKRMINKRGLIVGVFITLLFFLLILKTFQIQYVEAPVLKEKAQKIWSSSTTIDPKRGTIYDRNGERLAHNTSAYTVVAILSENYPNHVIDIEETARQLAQVLEMSESKIYSLLTKDVFQVELRPGGWKIDEEKAEEVRNLDLPGIILKEETKRNYPNNDFASHALGFLNYDNEAVLGVERQYDDILSGEAGELNVMKDLKGYNLPDGEGFYKPAKDGDNITLTIDKTIQQYVESALDKAEANYNPKRLVALVADPNTGEILAMSNRPNYNPNEYWNIEDYNNYAINYQFEPGSTFKIITLAAAIEEGIFNANDTFQSGQIKVPGGIVNDHNDGVGWGEITFLEGVQRSSNVAFVILGNQLGKDKLFYYIDKFGFGKKTDIDLPNESEGYVKDVDDVYPLDLASVSFGQGISVTPIQQLMAVSAVANGGELLQPYLVKEIRSSDDNEIIQQNEKTVSKRVISEETAEETREILESVVDFGQQKNGYIEGYHVAGKTGTSQKLNGDGTYSQERSVASFIGFAPADDPRLIVYVIVDEPDLNVPYYGSTVAVPIFKDIMLNSLRYLKVPIDSDDRLDNDEKKITINEYRNLSVLEAENLIKQQGLEPIVIGDGVKVIEQYPGKNTDVINGSKVYLITTQKDDIIVPDFIGMSLRDAVNLSQVLNIDISTTGNGIVINQSIAPNKKYNDEVIEIILEDPELINKDERID